MLVGAAEKVTSAVRAQFFPPADDDGCAKEADPAYTLEVELSSLSGCLLKTEDRPVALSNDGHVPLKIDGADGTLLHAPWAQSKSFTDAIGAWSQYIHGDAYLAPKGAVEIPLSARARSEYWSTHVHYLYALTIFLVALGVLEVVPAVKAETEVIFELRAEIFSVAVDLKSLETTIRRVSVEGSARVDVGQAAEGAGALVDALTCALGSTLSTSGKPDWRKLVDTGLACGKTAISDHISENKQALLGVVSGIPDAIKADLGLGDALKGLTNGANDSAIRLDPRTIAAATPGAPVALPTAACAELDDGPNSTGTDPVATQVALPAKVTLPVAED